MVMVDTNGIIAGLIIFAIVLGVIILVLGFVIWGLGVEKKPNQRGVLMDLTGYRTDIIGVAAFLLALIGKIDPSAGQLFLDFLKALGINLDPSIAAMFLAVIMLILREITTTPARTKAV